MKERVLQTARYIVDNRATVRQAAAAMGVVTYLVHLGLDTLIGGRVIPTVIAILVAVVVYVVIVLKIGTLSADDIEALPMGVRILGYCRRLHLMPEEPEEYED